MFLLQQQYHELVHVLAAVQISLLSKALKDAEKVTYLKDVLKDGPTKFDARRRILQESHWLLQRHYN